MKLKAHHKCSLSLSHLGAVGMQPLNGVQMAILRRPAHGPSRTPIHPGFVKHLDDLEVPVSRHPIEKIPAWRTPFPPITQQPPRHVRVAVLDRTQQIYGGVTVRWGWGGGVHICGLPQKFDHCPRIPFETE